ncbi:hypothetical protein DK28_0204440 [Peptococcaceae bacterium SCADC1_2_3]|nr:hypothetical protein DK28_0204440 [Peptococcaceae bacterium SCADC1_2_3]
MTKIIDSSTNERDNPFSVGQQVALKAEPSRQGVIIEVLPAVRGSIRYRIYHSPTEIREYDAEQIMMCQFHQPISRLDGGLTSQSCTSGTPLPEISITKR